MCAFRFIALAALCRGAELAEGELRGRSIVKKRSTLHNDKGLCSSVVAVATVPDDAHPRGLAHHEIEFECELGDGRTAPIQGTNDQMEDLKSLLKRGRLVSAESTVEVLPGVGRGGNARLPPGKVKARRGSHARSNRSRNLADSENSKPFLAVRVTDSRGRVLPDSARVISDRIFGTDGDLVNLKTLLGACSFGKYEVKNEYTEDITQHLSAPGVVDVAIPLSLDGHDRNAIFNAAVSALSEKLGLQLPGAFRHIMFLLEGCYSNCGWAAYAYINSWGSVYKGDYYKYVGVQMHEIGHNLNLAHSGGLDGREYSDHTCQMGSSYLVYYSEASDEEKGMSIMCFNPAKSFQLSRGVGGWYNENIEVWDSGTIGGTNWRGTIVGIADYKNNPDYRPVVVKLESGTSTDLFVGLNRAKNLNMGVVDARDQVTVVQAGNNGIGYSQSYLKSILSQGESFRVANWRGSGMDLTVHVEEINLSADPGYADVVMRFGDEPTENPTRLPTRVPTLSPTRIPTKRPTRFPTQNPTQKPSVGCGNNLCELGESSTSCPYDCSGRQLVSTFDYNRQSNGNMFLIKALCDIEITSFFINPNGRGDGMVKIYTRQGSYSGYERSGDGWMIIFYGVVHQQGRGKPIFLGNLLTRLAIPTGAYQSFYVFAENELVYTQGSQEFKKFASDSHIEFYEGCGVTGEFGSKVSPRVWNGIIQYNVLGCTTSSPSTVPTNFLTYMTTSAKPTDTPISSCGDTYCDENETASNCRFDCVDYSLETTYNYDSGSNGNMFVIKALRDIAITSLAINSMTRGEGAIKVYSLAGTYYGKHDSSEWELTYNNPSVQLNGRGEPTVLDDFGVLSLSAGETRSLYVWAEVKLVYKRGTGEGVEFVRDDSLVIYEGTGVRDTFGTVYSPRVWSGSIIYKTSVLG